MGHSLNLTHTKAFISFLFFFCIGCCFPFLEKYLSLNLLVTVSFLLSKFLIRLFLVYWMSVVTFNPLTVFTVIIPNIRALHYWYSHLSFSLSVECKLYNNRRLTCQHYTYDTIRNTVATQEIFVE